MKPNRTKKLRDSKIRRWWVIRTRTGEEYEAFVRERHDAIAYARQRGLKVDVVYLAKKR